MKKLSIALLVMASFLGLAACGNNSGGGSGGGGSGGGDSGGGTEDDGKIQINFYADFNQLNSKNVYHTYRVENGSKLTKPADPTTAPLPEFPVFLGWSVREIVDNKEDLWDFSTDVVQTEEKTFNLFGIWVAQGEQ